MVTHYKICSYKFYLKKSRIGGDNGRVDLSKKWSFFFFFFFGRMKIRNKVTIYRGVNLMGLFQS